MRGHAYVSDVYWKGDAYLKIEYAFCIFRDTLLCFSVYGSSTTVLVSSVFLPILVAFSSGYSSHPRNCT